MSTASDGGQQSWGGQPSEDGQPPEYGQPGYTATPGAGSNGIAVGALVLGLLSVPLGIIVLGGPLGLIAVILGFVGVSRARTMGGAGQGMAITGIVSGVLGILVAGVIFFLVGSVFTFFNSEEGQDTLEQIQSEVEAELGETAAP